MLKRPLERLKNGKKICYSSMLKKMSLHRSVNRLSIYMNNVFRHNFIVHRVPSYLSVRSRFLNISDQFHSSCVARDLMEFFDDKENWGEREVKVGRSWRLEELRIKSNSDLHKLWYVLLKERNMLLTMKHEYDLKFEPFPNPERIDKVEESMENLEAVVRERNRAYHELETGESGERPSGEAVNCFGLTYDFKMSEHAIPKHLNEEFLKEEELYHKTDDHEFVSKFLKRLQEKHNNIKLYELKQKYEEVCGLLERFPNMDEEALRQEYPDVDIEKAKKDKRSRGHRENMY